LENRGVNFRGVRGCDIPPTDEREQLAGQLHPFAGQL